MQRVVLELPELYPGVVIPPVPQKGVEIFYNKINNMHKDVICVYKIKDGKNNEATMLRPPGCTGYNDKRWRYCEIEVPVCPDEFDVTFSFKLVNSGTVKTRSSEVSSDGKMYKVHELGGYEVKANGTLEKTKKISYQQRLLAGIKNSSQFLKYNYKSELESETDLSTVEESYVGSHAIKPALQSIIGTSDEQRDAANKALNNCVNCREPFNVLHDITEYAKLFADEPIKNTSLEAIEEAKNCMHKFMAYVVRAENENKTYRDYLEGIEKKCSESRCDAEEVILITDWTEKLYALFWRESQLHYFGKRGYGLVGFCLILMIWNEDDGKAERKYIYFNLLLNGDNNQDYFAVVSALEPVLLKIMSEYPSIKCFSTISDNAGCYVNGHLPFFFALVSWIKSQ
jgi:hypothetical protein